MSDRTKWEHFGKINHSVQAVIVTIGPGQEKNVWYDFMKAQVEKCTTEIHYRDIERDKNPNPFNYCSSYAI